MSQSEGKSTFLDQALEQRFRVDGYVVSDLLDPDELERLVAALAEAVDKLVDTTPNGSMAFSDHSLEMAARRRLLDEVEAQLGPRLDEMLVDHRIVAATMVVKSPGAASVMDWHCDPSITDERSFVSLSAWLPLMAVDAGNGALEVMSGGHVGAPADRGGFGLLTNTWPSHAEVVGRCWAAGGSASGPVALRAGQCLFYDHRLPHRSDANSGSAPRTALNIGIAPRRAPLQVYIWDQGGAKVFPVRLGLFASQPLDLPPDRWQTGPASAVTEGGAAR